MTTARASLRQVDWRFLLPAPDTTGGERYEHAWIAGGDGPMVSLLADAGVARRISGGLKVDASVDAVVVLTGSVVDLEDAVERLRPGGVLCWQVDRSESGSELMMPRRALSRLRALGLGAATVYWTRNGHAAPTAYVPIGQREPLRWFVNRAMEARVVGVPALDTVRRAFAGVVAAGAAPFVRAFTVVAIADPNADPHVAAPAVCRSAGTPEAGAGTVFLLGGEGDWSRVTALPFVRGRRAPVVVVKLPRSARFNASTAHEHSVLARIADAYGADAGASLPHPVRTFQWGGLGGSVERLVDGVPLRIGGPRVGRSVAQLRMVTDWLTRFHTAPAAFPGGCRPDPAGFFEPPLDRYEKIFSPAGAEGSLLSAARARIRALPESEIPLVWEHHDLGPWNLFRSGEHLGIIDWEVARPGLGLCDILYFVMHWNWAARRATDERARRGALMTLLFPTRDLDPIGTAAAECVEDYMLKVGVSGEMLPVALVHSLVEQSLDRVSRLESLEEPMAANRGGNRYAGYLAEISTCADRLFSGPVLRPSSAAA